MRIFAIKFYEKLFRRSILTTFIVNGQIVSTERETRLVNFLRYNLHLTSVKDGCAEGACGTCTILIDGEAVRACTYVTSEMQGKTITTVEGLSEREKEVYTYAFGKAGAVQCGFCIPGMVICAKSLLDKNLNPNEKEIRHAIRNNICRCTGYVKIVKAIELAAEIFRNDADIKNDKHWTIGTRIPRVDVKDKVTGTGKYPDDIYIEGQLNVVAVRAKYPRAKVLSIDASAALAVPGIVAVFTAKDIPGTHIVGHLKKDWSAMIGVGEITHYLGDVIALVVGKERSITENAKRLVKVEYEVLPFVSSVEEASKPGAPLVHPEEADKGNLLGHTFIHRGNVDKAIKNAKYVISDHFSTPWTEHAFLETECAIAFPMDEGVKIYSTDQSVYDTRRETAPMLNLPPDNVIVENCYVGGGFGGKEDVTVQHYAALCALLTRHPCKMKLTREESILVHPKRHSMEMDFTLACDENGKILAVDAKIVTDNGAYASLGLPVLQRACTHASGPYNYQNFRIDGKAYYTNNPPAGAFRGFGVTQTCFAIETLINHMADKIGISHWDIRYINAIRPGDELPNGQIVDNATGLAETLLAVKGEYFANKYTGIACAMKNAGVGVGIPDAGRVRLEVKNRKVIIHCGGSCIGQGLCTILKQIICDITLLPPSLVQEEKANTLYAPDSGTTSGSRHTTITGEAARRAALKLKEEIKKAGITLKPEIVNIDSKELDDETVANLLCPLEGCEVYAEYIDKTDPFGTDVPHPKSHVAYGYATHVCVLDNVTHKVKKIVASHDVGIAINPTNVEGQIEGGVIMSLGYALREQYRLKDCKPLEKFASLGLFRADEVPEVEAVLIQKEGLSIASGGKGVGEITSIPTAPAVADAYYRLDGEKRLSLPIIHTPYIKPEAPNAISKQTKRLIINKNARCIGCLECIRACAKIFYKTEKQSMAHLAVRKTEGIGNESGLKGEIFRPVVCIQCGKCAKVCPKGAITKNASGVWATDLTLCDGCGKCREACPFDVIVYDEKRNTTTKCIACGMCAKACPMDVLSIAK